MRGGVQGGGGGCTSPVTRFLLRPMVDERRMLSVAPTHSKSSRFMMIASIAIPWNGRDRVVSTHVCVHMCVHNGRGSGGVCVVLCDHARERVLGTLSASFADMQPFARGGTHGTFNAAPRLSRRTTYRVYASALPSTEPTDKIAAGAWRRRDWHAPSTQRGHRSPSSTCTPALTWSPRRPRA